MSMIKYIMIILMITILLYFMGQNAPTHKMKENKMTSYECGFDQMNSARLPFSFRFFLVAILFLLFDLEIALLIPLSLSFSITPPFNSIKTLLMFMIILSVGLYYEWIMGGLDWAN